MTQILVYKLNHEIKMPQNANMLKKYGEIKMPRKFDAVKISCNKVIYIIIIYHNNHIYNNYIIYKFIMTIL